MKGLKKEITSLLLCLMLTACGAKEDAGKEAETGEESGKNSASQESIWQGLAPGDDLRALAERTEYYDIVAESENLFASLEREELQEQAWAAVQKGETVRLPLGTQFWQGEPVQLWSEASSEGIKIYRYRASGMGEVLLENVSDEHSVYSSYEGRHRWYLDRDGNFFCYYTRYSLTNGDEQALGRIIKLLPSGETLYETELDPGFAIKDLCQTEDGKVWLLLQEDGEELLRLAELDPATGQMVQGSRREIPFMRERIVRLGAAGGADLWDYLQGICRSGDCQGGSAGKQRDTGHGDTGGRPAGPGGGLPLYERTWPGPGTGRLAGRNGEPVWDGGLGAGEL